MFVQSALINYGTYFNEIWYIVTFVLFEVKWTRNIYTRNGSNNSAVSFTCKLDARLENIFLFYKM